MKAKEAPKKLLNFAKAPPGVKWSKVEPKRRKSSHSMYVAERGRNVEFHQSNTRGKIVKSGIEREDAISQHVCSMYNTIRLHEGHPNSSNYTSIEGKPANFYEHQELIST